MSIKNQPASGFWHQLGLQALLLCMIVIVGSTKTWAFAPPVTSLSDSQETVRVDMIYIEDKDHALGIDAIKAMRDTSQWQQLDGEYANFGYRPHPYWYAFEIENPSEQAVSQVLQLSYPLLDTVDLYRFKNGVLLAHTTTGDRLPYHARAVDHPRFLFPIKLGKGERNTFYLRVQTAGSQLVPMDLWQPVPLFLQIAEEDELHAVYFGIVMVIVIFNFLIFLALREVMYLYYCISTFLFMLFFAIMRAKLYPLVFSSTPEFHHGLLLLLPASCLLFSALFTREFLSVRQYSKPLNSVINMIIGITLLCMVGTMILDSQTSLKLSVLCVIPGTFILLLMGPMVAMMGNRVAWVYTFAWGTLMFGATVTAMSKHGFIPSNFATEYGMQLGSALEVFILNAALAYRFYREHEDRVAAQAAQLKENAERRDAELKLLQTSMSHPITLMPNRACFEQQIHEAILKRKDERIGVGIIEITRYTEISKTLGHQNTDLMLCDIAKQFNELMSKVPGIEVIHGPAFDAYICSLENASFGILLNADYAENHKDHINSVLKQLIQPVEFKDMRMELNPIVGVAVCPEHGLNASTLMRHAQVAVDSPEAIQNHLAYYRPEHDQYNTRRLMMISELKDAIKKDDLEVYLQPKYDPAQDKVVGVEALVRWHHRRFGTIRPDDFIPMAEETGIIKPLTRWVVLEALAAQKQLADSGHSLSMSINLSAVNLKESDLTDFLGAALKSNDSVAEQVFLELTETSMMQHPEEAIAKLEEIRALGIKVSIDDFGSGYSSLAYLKSLPANEIKIDRALIQNVTNDKQHETVVRMAIEMCHELDFQVVAEGVETQAQQDRMTDLSCDLVQGYLLTPPLPLSKLTQWLEEHGTNRRFVS